MIKILIGALLALATANAMAENVFIYEDKERQASNTPSGKLYIHKDKRGQVLLTNVNSSGNFDRYNKKVKETRYAYNNKDGKISYGSSRAIYSNSAYNSLR